MKVKEVLLCAVVCSSALTMFGAVARAEEPLTTEQLSSVTASDTEGGSLPPAKIAQHCIWQGVPCEEKWGQGGDDRCYHNMPKIFLICGALPANLPLPIVPLPPAGCLNDKQVQSCWVVAWEPTIVGDCGARDVNDGDPDDRIKDGTTQSYPKHSNGCEQL